MLINSQISHHDREQQPEVINDAFKDDNRVLPLNQFGNTIDILNSNKHKKEKGTVMGDYFENDCIELSKKYLRKNTNNLQPNDDIGIGAYH